MMISSSPISTTSPFIVRMKLWVQGQVRLLMAPLKKSHDPTSSCPCMNFKIEAVIIFLFDGIICFEDTNGQQQRYVQAIPFDILSIGAYEDTNCHSVGSLIWIQSAAGKASTSGID